MRVTRHVIAAFTSLSLVMAAAVSAAGTSSAAATARVQYSRSASSGVSAPHLSIEPRAAATASLPGTADNSLDSMFASYGDNATCADWGGGDATNSIVLPNGERAWFFSDTYLNNASARVGLWYASAIHNSIVIQNGSSLTTTITGGNTCQETNMSLSFWSRYANTPANAPDSSNGGFYWTGDQMLAGSNVVKFYYHGYPTGNNSFVIDYPAVASLPASSLENDSAMTITPAKFSCGAPDIIWGSSLLNWDGAVYVYGWAANFSGLYPPIYLAKTDAADLASPASWQLFTGTSGGSPTWTNCSGNPAALAITDANGSFSVESVNGTLWEVQDDYTNGQLNTAGEIAAHPSPTPWGFTNSSVPLYNPPEGFLAYPYYYQVYEPRFESGLGPSGDLAISYNVNTVSVDTGCISANAHDVSIYRPRFIDVPTSAFDASAATAPAIVRTVQAASAPSGSARLAAAMAGMSRGRDVWPPVSVLPSSKLSRQLNQAGVSRPKPHAAAAVPASTSTSIGGVTDWYYKPLGSSCPSIPAPATPTITSYAFSVTSVGSASVGTDVWYYGYMCDATASNCSSEGTASPWKQGWWFQDQYGGGFLWHTVPSGSFYPVQAFSSSAALAASGHTFAFYLQSFGAGNGSGGGNSPEVNQAVTAQLPRSNYEVQGNYKPATGVLTIQAGNGPIQHLTPLSKTAIGRLESRTAASAGSFSCAPSISDPSIAVYQSQTSTSSIASTNYGSDPNLSGSYLNYFVLTQGPKLGDGSFYFYTDVCTFGTLKENNGWWLYQSGASIEAETFADINHPINYPILFAASPGQANNGSVISSVTIGAAVGPVNIGATVPLVSTGTYTSGLIGSDEPDVSGTAWGANPDMLNSPSNEVSSWWYDNSWFIPGTSDPVAVTDEALYRRLNTDLTAGAIAWNIVESYEMYNPGQCPTTSFICSPLP